jgi:hypothetical protein
MVDFAEIETEVLSYLCDMFVILEDVRSLTVLVELFRSGKFRYGCSCHSGGTCWHYKTTPSECLGTALDYLEEILRVHTDGEIQAATEDLLCLFHDIEAYDKKAYRSQEKVSMIPRKPRSSIVSPTIRSVIGSPVTRASDTETAL